MARPPKVFGCTATGVRWDTGNRAHNQARVVVCAASLTAAIRVAKAQLGNAIPGRAYWDETGNQLELDVAQAKPGQVFATQDLGYRNPEYLRVIDGQRVRL